MQNKAAMKRSCSVTCSIVCGGGGVGSDDVRRQTAALIFIVLLLQLIPVAEFASASQRQHRHGGTASAGSGSSSRRSTSGTSSSSSSSATATATAYDDYAERTNFGNYRDFDEGNADYEDGGASMASSSNRHTGGSSGGRRRDNGDNGGDGDQRWPPENCTQCSARQVKRDYRIESIKSDILRKLRLSRPPNVTATRLPAIPHIQRIVDELSYQSDAPWTNHEQQQYEADDDHATPLKVLIFAVPGK